MLINCELSYYSKFLLINPHIFKKKLWLQSSNSDFISQMFYLKKCSVPFYFYNEHYQVKVCQGQFNLKP